MTQHPPYPNIAKDKLALALMQSANICSLEAAHFLVELTQSPSGNKRRLSFTSLKRLVDLGAQAQQEHRKSISFSRAVALTLNVKQQQGRRARTLQEIKTISNRLLKHCPELKRKKVRAIKTDECRRYLSAVFTTPRQFAKARVVLSGIFTVAIQHGYADKNPIKDIAAPVIKEKEVAVLSLDQVQTLTKTACRREHAACLVPMALMTYAGIRPKEVERLTWADICMEDRVIRIRAEHSKTGGARHVSIHKPLYRILTTMIPQNRGKKICPPNWTVRWSRLRKDAGWNAQTNPWQQDCLRHTFATYHIKHFRDYKALQYEMGHRSSDLLRTRYINLGTITQMHAQCFWTQCVRMR